MPLRIHRQPGSSGLALKPATSLQRPLGALRSPKSEVSFDCPHGADWGTRSMLKCQAIPTWTTTPRRPPGTSGRSADRISGVGLMTFAERSAKGSNIHNFGQGLWWAIETVTTVGYGDRSPVSTFGQGVAVFFMLVGIGLIGVLTATIASYFVQEKTNQRDQRLERIETLLTQLLAGQNETVVFQRFQYRIEWPRPDFIGGRYLNGWSLIARQLAGLPKSLAWLSNAPHPVELAQGRHEPVLACSGASRNASWARVSMSQATLTWRGLKASICATTSAAMLVPKVERSARGNEAS